MPTKGVKKTTKWVKKTLNAMFTVVGISLMVGMSNAAILSFSGMTETGAVKTIASDSYFYSGCYTPIKIYINPEGVDTHSTDAKIFLTGTFDLQSNTSEYLGFVPGVFDNYLTWSSVTNRDNHIGTGSATSGTYNNWMYHYINAYTNTGTFVNGSTNQLYSTIYVKPNSTTAHLDFYFLGNGVNDDDSNVASGINNNTQYNDVLSSVEGTGDFNVITTNLYACVYNPYIISRARYDSILGSGTYDSFNKRTYIDANDFAGYDVFTSIDPFEGDIQHKAGPHLSTGDYTSEDSWTIWTNQPITITLSGNQYDYMGTSTGSIKLDTGVFASADLSLNTMVGNEDTWTTEKVITVSDNIETGINFYNRIGNEGSRYESGNNNYYDTFLIDVFRFDDTPTTVTGISLETGDGYEVISLSGYASNLETSSHAKWTIDDDRFRIIGFSGYNTTKYGYTSTTGYNSDLNDKYVVNGSAQNFDMVKTGNYQTNDLTNLTTTDTGAIVFTETRSGYIYYSDIAGNISGVFVSVDVNKLVDFEITVHPAYREEASDLSTTGELRVAQKVDGTRAFTHKYADGDPKVVINENGTGHVRIVIPASGNEYLTVFKGSGFLSVGFTGVRTNDPDNTSTNYFDFSSGDNNVGTHTDLAGGRYFNNIYYLLQGDLVTDGANYDLIETANEISLINQHLTVGLDNIAGSDYYRYDADLNDVINAVEQAIVIQDNLSYGFIGDNTVSPLVNSDYNTAS